MTDIKPELIEKAAKALADDWNPERDPILSAMFRDYARTALSSVADDLRAEGAAKALDEHLPCDGGCDDGPMEMCSRHGRRVAEVWELVSVVQAEVWDEGKAAGLRQSDWEHGDTAEMYVATNPYRKDNRHG